MIPPFSIKPQPAITFGAGCIANLCSIVESLGTRFLIITGVSFRSRQRSWSTIENQLLSLGIQLDYATIDGEPTAAAIDLIVDSYFHDKIDGVVAIGGGSVLDAGKAVSAMLPAGEPVEQFLEGVGTRKPDGITLPFVAVPTTAGTGSEASANAVITKSGRDGYKKSLRHPNYIPDFALIDPELMLSCSPSLTAACSMDTFSQLVEGFLSTQASPMTDAIAWSGLESLQVSLVQVFQNGEDIRARSYMAYAALCSGIVLANAGLGVIHGLAPGLGSNLSIAHGVVCGTLMGTGNQITLEKLHKLVQSDGQYQPFIDKYQRLGRLFCSQPTGIGKEAESFIDEVHRIIEMLGLPSLSDCGAGTEDLEAVLETASNKNNPVMLSKEDIKKILLLRL